MIDYSDDYYVCKLFIVNINHRQIRQQPPLYRNRGLKNNVGVRTVKFIKNVF